MTTEPRPWQPGDPVYTDQPAELACSCGVRVLWRPDTPLDCPECGNLLLAAAPAGTGSPTPAPDVEIDLLEDQDGAPYPEEVQESHRYAIADLRAELSQVQRERDEKQEAIRGYQCMLDDIRAATGTAGATKDDPPTDLRALSVVVADMRIARDEARSALAALRAEVGKIATRLEGYRQSTTARQLRALVTDQSPAAPPIIEPLPMTSDEAAAFVRAAADQHDAEVDDCISCGEMAPDEARCPKSQHVWTHDGCDWCGAEFGEEGLSPTSDTQTDGSGTS